jgi:hypothetical protein
MKTLFPALAAAILATSMSGPALAQPPGASEHAPGVMKKEEGGQSATERAPGQMQNEGAVDSARDAAPGQIDRETTASIALSAEQRTEVRRIFVDAAPPADIEVDLRVGTAIPETVALQSVPVEVVEIAPAYERYRYFVAADGRVVLVEPATLEIAYIIDAES